jgi:STE24 endopeptidase
MYFAVIAILGLVLTLDRPIFQLVREPGPTLAILAGATLVPAVFGVLLSRRVLGMLDREPGEPSRAQAAFSRGMWLLQLALAAAHGGVLVATPWLSICARTPGIGAWPVVPSIYALLPFLLAIVLTWVAVFPADRAIRQLALEVYLVRGRPTRPVWTLFQYLLYSLRHQVLFVLVPMLLILAAHDFVVLYQEPLVRWTRLRFAPDLLIGGTAVLVAIITPELLRHIWSTQRLPDGPLRDRLLQLARKLGVRCRDILVWRSGGLVVNAAVMGVIPPLRYVLITDAMLEQMDDTKIEAVFGHEAGHVKRHHILFFLMFAFVSGCLVTIFTIRTHGLYRHDPTRYQVIAGALLAVLALKWTLFGWISRRFERQADVYGVRSLALNGLPCVQACGLHTASADTPPNPLCRTAAHVYAEALHEVALLNGIPAESGGFRHPSIGKRVRFLHRLALDALGLRRFERGTLVVKALIVVVALVAGAWAAYDLRVLDALQAWR